MKSLNQEKSIRIELPFKTPTVNHIYGQHGHRRYLKTEAKLLRNKIIEIVGETKIDFTGKMFVHVAIHEDWYCKNGMVKRKDLSNREKFLIDSIFEALGIDDKMIFKHTMEKIQDNQERAVITIGRLEGEINTPNHAPCLC